MTLSLPRIFSPAFLGFALVLAPAVASAANQMETRWVTILAATKSFPDAKAEALRFSKASGLPFSMEDRIFDPKRGLIYPDNYEIDSFAGGYVVRRGNATEIKDGDAGYISIERAEDYGKFKDTPVYVVVAGVHEDRKIAEAQAKQFAPWAPTAYARKTKLYMGCLL